jgi:PAS domain S-box-containing protein
LAPLQTVHIASPSPRDSNASGRIHATGEMADLVRAFDWSTTPLGPISSWTDPLLTIVNTLLASRHPLFLWWGEDLIQFYNDAYRPSLGRGKHPKALGQRGQECWREVWESIGPQIHSVLHGGESTWNVDQYLPIYRNGDQLEDAWWTFSYSPVHDASGHIAGIFVVVAETTQRVLAERELARSRETLHLTVESAGLGTWSYDASTDLSTIDASMQRIFGSPQASGDFAYWITFVHPDDRDHVAAEFNAAISGRAPYESEYRIIRPDGTTRWIRSKGRVLPGTEGPLRLFVVVEDITGRKLAEEALRNSEQRLQLALESANLGTWSFDEETGISTGDPAMQRIFGSDRAAGDFHYWIEFSHPDDREAITADFAAALASDAPYVTEHRIVRPTDGEVRWIRSLGRVLREPGRPLHGPRPQPARHQLRRTSRSHGPRKYAPPGRSRRPMHRHRTGV